MTDTTPQTAGELVQALRQNAISCVDIAQALIARVEKEDNALQSIEHLNKENLLEQAQQLDSDFKTKSGLPLYGVPIGVKDIIDVAGMPTGFGSQAPIGYEATVDADVVYKLRQAGALIAAKTVSTELAFFAPSKTHNPNNLSHTPGGSSAGSAASVAAGLLPLSIGTQTAGSVIRPASFCGVFGLKTTYGLLDRQGVLSQSPSLDTLGFMSRTLPDLDLILQGITALAQPEATHRPLRVACLDFDAIQSIEPSMCHMLDRVTESLEQSDGSGVSVTKVKLSSAFDHALKCRTVINLYELKHAFADLYKQYPSHLKSETCKAYEESLGIEEKEYLAAIESVRPVRAEINELFKSIDYLVTPAALGPAPSGLGATGNPILAAPWTLLGHPSLSLPVATDEQGMPLGLQLIGNHFKDRQLVSDAKIIMTQLNKA